MVFTFLVLVKIVYNLYMFTDCKEVCHAKSQLETSDYTTD